jgi:Bacterial Ig-like domain (group 1)
MNQNTQILSRAMVNFPRLTCIALVLAAALSLNGCGGGSGAGSVGGGVTSAKVGGATIDAISALAKGLDVLTSEASVNTGNSGRNSANITVLVKDDGNRALQDATVVLKSNDPQSTLQVFGSKTASDGTLKATLTSTGQANRNIDIVATVGSLTKTLTIPAVGTVVTVSGPSAVTNGGSGNFSVSVRDAAGAGLKNSPVSLSSTIGNTFSPASVNTNDLGQATFTLNVSKVGTDNIKITSAGSSISTAVTAASASLAFMNVVAGEEITLNTSKAFQVKLADVNGVDSKSLSVSSSRGTVTPSTLKITTSADGQGLATFSVSSTSAGPATIAVTGPSSTSVTAQVEFVSKTPANVNLQPFPAIVASNSNGSTAAISALTVLVTDANSQPVKGIEVGFRADNDPSGGRISPVTAKTDSTGRASVTFTPGATASGSNGVKITSYVTDTPTIAASTNLTVTNSGISIRIGTGNKLESEASLRNKYLWTALVVDSSGNPVANAPVQVLVTPLEYVKGFWSAPSGATEWSFVSVRTCPSEDGLDGSPLDGVLQAAVEDKNTNGRLDPGGVATVEFKNLVNGKAVTASSGFIDFTISYAKVFASATKIRIDVKTQVNGSEASVSQTFTLLALAEDLSDVTIAPPSIRLNGQNQGPFGVLNSCTDAN